MVLAKPQTNSNENPRKVSITSSIATITEQHESTENLTETKIPLSLPYSFNESTKKGETAARGSSEDFHDPACDPKKPVKISFQDVTSAAFVIRNGIEKTPCMVIY